MKCRYIDYKDIFIFEDGTELQGIMVGQHISNVCRGGYAQPTLDTLYEFLIMTT